MPLISENVVVTANQFNPTVMTQLWLVQNGILAENEGPGIYVPGFVQVKTDDFELLVLLDRLQFVPTGEQERRADLVVEKVGTIVRTLPHTPYTAAGLNFVWRSGDFPEGIAPASRRLFFKENSIIANDFMNDNARFGAFFSKDLFGCRLKLTALPARDVVSGDEFLEYSFNFHRDVTGPDSVQAITETLAIWDPARQFSRELASRLEGG